MTIAAEALRTLGRYASNQELSFTWYDAAVLSQKIRQTVPPPKRVDARRVASSCRVPRTRWPATILG